MVSPRLSVVQGGHGARSAGDGHAQVKVDAPGKVNLFLSCGQRRADGYHPLATVFQAVRLIETVTARRQSADCRGEITLRCEGNSAVPTDSSNLAYRAAELLAQHCDVREGVDLTIRKRVPMAGGMAGGSADAAATLVACNALWGCRLEMAELMPLAATLGADVPFCLMGSTAVGVGRGDQLTPLLSRGSYHWVCATQQEGLSTPQVFACFDDLLESGRGAGLDPALSGELAPVPQELSDALRRGDAQALAAHMHNDLEAAALHLRPELRRVIEVAQEAGALRAMISGSGPTVVALCASATDAQRVSRTLLAQGLCAEAIRTDAPVAGARVVH